MNDIRYGTTGMTRPMLILRGFQALFTLLTLALTAFAASVFVVFAGYGLNFFTAIWTGIFFAFIFFGITRISAQNKPGLIALVLEGFTAFWWLVTFAVVASEAVALADAESLFNLYGADGLDYFGTHGNAAVGATQGAAAIGAFNFVLFIATIVLNIMAMNRASAAGNPADDKDLRTSNQMYQQHQQGQMYPQPEPVYQHNQTEVQNMA